MIRKYQEQLEKINELKPQLKSKGFIDDKLVNFKNNWIKDSQRNPQNQGKLAS